MHRVVVTGMGAISCLGTSLDDPSFGAGTVGFLTALVQGGFANDAAFGGGGDTVITTLGAHQIYATLVPEAAVSDFTIGATYGGQSLSESAETLGLGETLYLVPEPGTAWLVGLGFAGISAGAASRRSKGRARSRR